MRKELYIIGMVMFCFVALMLQTGCDQVAPKSDAIVQKKQERAMQEMVRQTGLPAIHNYQEKKMMKMLYELRDKEDLVCHAYLVNMMTGIVGQYLGKCIGYGLPASTQYSNPEKRMRHNNMSSQYSYNIPQAEPNGLFMPEGLSATWLMMIDPTTGDARPVYIEPQIIVSPFKIQ
jgi:hypothetical protein